MNKTQKQAYVYGKSVAYSVCGSDARAYKKSQAREVAAEKAHERAVEKMRLVRQELSAARAATKAAFVTWSQSCEVYQRLYNN